MTDALKRRHFLGGGVAAAAVTATASRAEAAPAAAAPVRAAVLELRDQWTGSTGAARLLEEAGAVVVPLDPTLPATAQGADLIVFGGFTNNAPTYLSYVAAQASSLQEFVAAGGVVLDLAQSDQFGADTAYLPSPLKAVRADPDHTTVYPLDPAHPLVAPLPVAGGLLLQGRSTAMRTSYETLLSWREMRVLLACTEAGQAPCLLEGAHGTGRFLVSSLTVDKCWDAAGVATQPAAALADSATFFAALVGYVDAVRAGTAPAVVPTPVPTEPATGPMVGHTTHRTSRIWVRPGSDHQDLATWQVVVRGGAGTKVVTAALSEEHDFTVIFEVAALRPDTRYTFEISPVGGPSGFIPLTGSFTTAPSEDARAVVTMGLGSCAPSAPDAVWDRVLAEGCDSFVFLGDTPYIDSTDVRLARQRHREFLAMPEVARMVRSMPVWGTWDDHDFGGNDVDGTLSGKRNNRTAFVDYRANATYGQNASGKIEKSRSHDSEGVYTSFRRGPIEVFLLDPRWFSRTGPSWADPDEPTAIGKRQWQWLKQGLTSSTATFKVIASGMIWDDKQNTESDDWGTYVHEREAIFNFVAAEKIKGVVLTSGDIHVSRALNYGPRVGYDLWQYIVSPLHDRTIPSLNVPHPALVHSAVEPRVFLKLVADTTVKPARLSATWINREGRRIFSVEQTSDGMGYGRMVTPDAEATLRHEGRV